MTSRPCREDTCELGKKLSVSVIILAFNESIHIERCIRSVLDFAEEVIVVDSYSTDDTTVRAQRLGARVIQHEWKNHAAQVNWALENARIRSRWVMRLDADEFLDATLAEAIRKLGGGAPEDVGGFEVNRRIRFMGRDIRHGGMAPMWVTRIWRNGWAQCEARWMDEHMVLRRGQIAQLPGLLIDENLNSLTWWTSKHNHYASREAIDLLDRRYQLGEADQREHGLNRQARFKRWLKTQVYARLPTGIRPWLYFCYRALFRLGILDGTRGMMYHMLQGLWYRMLVDAKVEEIEQCMKMENCDVREAIHRTLGICLTRNGVSPLPTRAGS